MSHEFLSIRAFRVQKQINGFLMNQFMNINYLFRTPSERLPNSASTLLEPKYYSSYLIIHLPEKISSSFDFNCSSRSPVETILPSGAISTVSGIA